MKLACYRCAVIVAAWGVAGVAGAPRVAAQGEGGAPPASLRSGPRDGAAAHASNARLAQRPDRATCGVITAIDTHAGIVTVHDPAAHVMMRVRLANARVPAALALRVGAEVVQCDGRAEDGRRHTAPPYTPGATVVLHLRGASSLVGTVVSVAAG
ncbi:MAG TPA: hypothetical protein VFK13_11005 [Gemmatimonadaceae bacterium]|nr:hypothetical protein [Gemmatimonadaceae bacterium]